MASNLTRISAPHGEAMTRYVVNRIIAALLNRETVLLLSLDPFSDPYVAEMDELRAQAFYHDCDLIPDAPGHLGGQLAYVCWAGAGGDGSPQMFGRLRRDPSSLLEPATWSPDTLIIVDGCQWLGRAPLSEVAPQIREFIAGCVAESHRVVVVGEQDRDTEWLDVGDAMISVNRMLTSLSAAS